MTYCFTVNGKPQGKGRPRFNGKTGTTYTPKATRDYEKLVVQSFLNSYHGCPKLEGEISVMITAHYQIPKNTRKADREAMLARKIRPTVKPDLDNVVKAILDALNGCAYTDDSAIVSIEAVKDYSDKANVFVMLSDKAEEETK